MSVRTRLILLAAVMIAVLVMPAYYGLRQLTELRSIALELRGRHAADLIAAGQLEETLLDLERHLQAYAVAPDPAEGAELYDLLDRSRRHLLALEQGGYRDEVGAVTTHVDSLQALTERLDALFVAGDTVFSQALLAPSRDQFRGARQAVTAMAETIDAQSEAAALRAEQISARAARTAAIGTGIAAGLAVSLAAIAILTLVAPLRRLRAAMAAVAAGRFIPPRGLPYGRPDEIGDLSRSFRMMTERLAELDRMKAEFVGIAGHELKTPVHVIRGYTEMLEDGFYGSISERQEGILSQIRDQADLLTERVNQLLSVSRMEARGVDVEATDVATRDLLDAVQRSFGAVARQREIDFRVELHPTAPRRLFIDGTRVQNELLGNLLTNAFKFTPAGGEVRLRVKGENGRVLFELRDSGEGIPETELPYIFEKYYQAGSHAGKVGAGLGLAIAREVVEAHSGTISARSEPGTGTTFFVEFPARVDGRGLPGPPGREGAVPAEEERPSEGAPEARSDAIGEAAAEGEPAPAREERPGAPAASQELAANPGADPVATAGEPGTTPAARSGDRDRG